MILCLVLIILCQASEPVVHHRLSNVKQSVYCNQLDLSWKSVTSFIFALASRCNHSHSGSINFMCR